MNDQQRPYRVTFATLSLLAGFAAAYNLALNLYRGSLQTNLDWVVMLSLLTFAFGAIFFQFMPFWWDQYQASSVLVRYWVLLLVLVSAVCFTLNSSALIFLTALIFQLFICALLALPGFVSFHQILEQHHPVRFFCAWLLGTLFA